MLIAEEVEQATAAEIPAVFYKQHVQTVCFTTASDYDHTTSRQLSLQVTGNWEKLIFCSRNVRHNG